MEGKRRTGRSKGQGEGTEKEEGECVSITSPASLVVGKFCKPDHIL